MENKVSDYRLIEWGINEVSKVIPDDAIVEVEPRCEISTGRGQGIYGYADLISNEHIFDLKSGGVLPNPGYRAQLSGYALSHMEKTYRDYVWCHELYIDAKYHRKYKITFEEASDTVDSILKNHNDPKAEPQSCTYCKWCRHNLSCSALTDNLEEVEFEDIDAQLDELKELI